MELNLQKQTVSINETIYDGVVEQPLECDVLLPDYCPDIQKILRCEVVPSLLLTAVNGDKLSVDGMAMAHLYYLDENGCIRHAEYKIPYTRVVELRCAPQNPSVCVTQSVDYFNCRAVSSRRLDMRGAVTMNVRVTGQTEEEVLVAARGRGTPALPPTRRRTPACCRASCARRACARRSSSAMGSRPWARSSARRPPPRSPITRRSPASSSPRGRSPSRWSTSARRTPKSSRSWSTRCR